jgi:D-serine deaminase-like pyridoxal phosphate-dependent protein
MESIILPQSKTHLTSSRDIIAEARDRARAVYGSAIGRKRNELVTPALILDLEIMRGNLDFMADHMKKAPSKLRAHIKVHKSPDIALMQVKAGAIGVGTATLWEAIVMARSGIQDVFIVNQVIRPEMIRAAALLAREVPLKIAVDDATNAKALSDAAKDAGTVIGCVIEVDTGMYRSGVNSPEEALGLARRITELPRLRLDGITGYEGHCSREFDKVKRERMTREALSYFVGVAEKLRGEGLPCPIVSAGGTATWELTANYPGVTEIQPGSYATMDGYHSGLEPRFKQATTVLATILSRRSEHIVTDVGAKTVGATQAVFKEYNYKISRYDEEHGIFSTDDTCPLRVGDTAELLPGYTPFAVSYFDVYHVVEKGRVIDVWPVLPRGPEHGGLLDVFKEQ